MIYTSKRDIFNMSRFAVYWMKKHSNLCKNKNVIIFINGKSHDMLNVMHLLQK